ncbi:MAG: hypothetical protein AB8B91_09110 [Rubripirellula sp.]
MNAIARRHRAEVSFHTTPDAFSRLRLLSKPIFRYDSQNDVILDGAVYGFVDATDPEMLLVIEARRHEGKTSWLYSPARSRHDQMRLYLGDDIVWDLPALAPPWVNVRDPKKSYFNVHWKTLAGPSELGKLAEIFSSGQ